MKIDSKVKNKTFVIIPAFNEAKRIGAVISEIQKKGEYRIVVVDDDSSDLTIDTAKKYGVEILSHIINRGPGAATQTGLTYAYNQGAEYFITIDGDGQHDVSDLEVILKTVMDKDVDVVFGSRMLGGSPKPPLIRRIFNVIANVVTFFLSSIWLSDTQTGFKAFNRRAVSKIGLTTDGYEFCSEIVTQVKYHNLKYKEVPISVYYTKESMEKGQNFATGLRTVFRLFIMALSK